jgi:hypothetical protein
VKLRESPSNSVAKWAMEGGRTGSSPSAMGMKKKRMYHRGCVFLDEAAREEQIMRTLRKQGTTLSVDRSSQQWIVLDQEGNFWIVPSAENPWDHRQPFQPSGGTDLEPIPGHYKSMLGIPF